MPAAPGESLAASLSWWKSVRTMFASVCTSPGSRTGCPSTPTYTSQSRTRPAHSSEGGWSAAGKRPCARPHTQQTGIARSV